MANRKCGIVQYMLSREYGVKKGVIKKSDDTALSIGEEKATLPVKNQPCELSGQSRSTFLMAFSPNGKKIASTHGDHTVRVTDTRSGRCTHILTGHPRTPWCIAFHPTSNDILATGCLGGEVRIWDLHGGGSEVWKSGSGYVISSLAFHPVDQVLVFAQGNEIHFWDWKESQPFAHCKTANDYEKVRWVKFDVWGHHLFTGIANGSTVQRNDSLGEYSYISVPHASTFDRRRLRNEYNMLVNRMSASQRLRIHTAYPPGISNTQSEIELVEPTSPTHNSFNPQGLNDATRYAAEVTSHRRRALRNAREYAAHVTSEAFQDAARRVQEAASSTAQSSDRYQDSQRSETDSDIPAASSPRPRQAGLFNLTSREPCEPVTSSSTSGTNSQSVVSSSSDSITRNVMLPDFCGPTAVSNANLARRSSTLARPPQPGSSLLRSRLCASAASSSETAPQTSGSGAIVGSASESMASNAAGATATSGTEPVIVSTTSAVTAGNSSASSAVPGSSSSSASVNSRPSLLRSFLSVPPLPNNTVPNIVTSSDRTPIVVSSASTNPPIVIYSGDESRNVTPAAAGSSTTGLFSFSRNYPTNEPSVTGSGENDTTRNVPTATGATRNDQIEEPEPGTSCPENCGICSGMPGVRETFAQHRMRMRRRRLALRSSGLGRRGIRRSPGNPPSESLSNERPQRERTQTLASYIDSEVRRVLGQQDGQESDSSDSTAERSDGSYEQPTALIIPSSASDNNTNSNRDNHSESSVSSLSERRRQLYERLRNDVREMENDVRDLRNVMRQRQMEMRMQSLMRYRQRREDRQRRIDERLHLSGMLGAAGRGRSGPRLSRCQNPAIRTAERQRRTRLHLEDIRAGYRDAIRDVHRQIPQITVTQASPESEETPNPMSRSATGDTIRRLRTDMLEERHAGQLRSEDRAWHSISRRNLHQHYSTNILDDTINRPDDGLHAAINRAIAGAFMGTGEAAVASNIVSVTHRIQRWDFTNAKVPDITDNTANIIVAECKLHNDASVDIAQDGSMLAVLVPSARGFPNDTITAVFSLTEDTLGQCLYTKSFGPNAISVSISPLNNYVLVGLAAKKLQWVFTPKQMVAQVFKMKTKEAGEDSMEHICDLMHPCDLDIRTHVSVNSARWLPGVGEGIIYGTNRGDLHICRPGDDEKDKKDRPQPNDASESNSIRRNLMQMLGIDVPDTTSTATQTVHRIRRTASTQTDGAASNPNAMPTSSSTADQRNGNMYGRNNNWYLPNAPR